MHRRTDLWGPDGMYDHNFSLNTTSWLIDSPFNFYIALKFDPDRFLDYRVQKYLTPNPFIFCPFNAGPRICLGQQVYKTHSYSFHKLNFFIFQFAYHEATYFLVRLLQEFTGFKLDKSQNIQPPAEWATCEGLKKTEKVHPGSHLTMFVRVSSILFLKFGLLKSV